MSKSAVMKKNIFLWALLTTIFSYSHAQSKSSSVRLNAYGSYVFDDKVDDYYSSTSFYNGKIKGGFLWGAGLEYRVHEYYGIELLYQRLDTKAPIEYYDPNAIGNNIKNADLDVAIDYIMLGEQGHCMQLVEKLNLMGDSCWVSLLLTRKILTMGIVATPQNLRGVCVSVPTYGLLKK